MNQPGDNEIYVVARRVLLDALEALHDHRQAIILVGAQAIYLHTGDADLAVAPYTADADLAIDPSYLQDYPLLAAAMRSKGFQSLPTKLGTWTAAQQIGGVAVNVPVDLLVPAAVGGPGRRAAKLGPHGDRAARKAAGLEGAIVDNRHMRIEALDPDQDGRVFDTLVAGPAALLVSKLHKIADRVGDPGRAVDKDALDVLRLLVAVTTGEMAHGLTRLVQTAVSATVTRDAVAILQRLFSAPHGKGAQMAARAAAPMESEETIHTSCAVLAGDLIKALSAQ